MVEDDEEEEAGAEVVACESCEIELDWAAFKSAAATPGTGVVGEITD